MMVRSLEKAFRVDLRACCFNIGVVEGYWNYIHLQMYIGMPSAPYVPLIKFRSKQQALSFTLEILRPSTLLELAAALC